MSGVMTGHFDTAVMVYVGTALGLAAYFGILRWRMKAAGIAGGGRNG